MAKIEGSEGEVEIQGLAGRVRAWSFESPDLTKEQAKRLKESESERRLTPEDVDRILGPKPSRS